MHFGIPSEKNCKQLSVGYTKKLNLNWKFDYRQREAPDQWHMGSNNEDCLCLRRDVEMNQEMMGQPTKDKLRRSGII